MTPNARRAKTTRSGPQIPKVWTFLPHHSCSLLLVYGMPSRSGPANAARTTNGPMCRALDGNDLVALLEQAPAVAHWFARLIGKLPATGVISLDEWWENWSTVAVPRISPELVTAGRQDEADRLAQWFQGESSHYYLQGDTPEEAIAFLAASTHSKCSQWGTTLMTRAVVVQNVDAWRSIEGHQSPFVLVRDFSSGNVSPQMAVGRGHHVLTPLGRHQEPRGTGVTLPRLGREETREALEKMGLSEAKARVLTRSAARRLPIMRRQLVDEAGGPMPEWVSSFHPSFACRSHSCRAVGWR